MPNTTTTTEVLTHEDCLAFGSNTPCEGAVERYPVLPERWTTNGTYITTPRCAKHYDEYEARYEERCERESQYQASLYCKHGTYIGDPYGADYICGACESE